MNRKTLSKALTTLSVKPGDLLLVQCDDLAASNQLAEAIAQLRNQMKLPKCLVVVLQKGDKLESIDADVMRRMGWVKQNDISYPVNRPNGLLSNSFVAGNFYRTMNNAK
jgi:hypothetical protein